MHTAVFVTPLLDPDHPVRGFATTHLRALASRFERVVVIAGRVRNDLGDLDNLEVKVVTAGTSSSNCDGLRIGPALERVLAEVDADSPVLVEDDLAGLVQGHAVTRDRANPLFWWCPSRPSTRAATEAARWADGLLVAAAPDPPVAGCPTFTVGAGIDVAARSGLSNMAPHPPLRLMAVGSTSAHRGLDVIVRAVAKAHGRGTDARLLIVGPSTNLAEWHCRAGLESLVTNLALTSSVRIDHAMTPLGTAEMMQRAHVLVDAGTNDGLARSALEAMAGARIVLSSSAAVAPMLDHTSPVPLTFTAGDPVQLAERLVGLAAAWPTSLQNIASALRVAVEAEHSIDQWADRVLGAVCATGRA